MILYLLLSFSLENYSNVCGKIGRYKRRIMRSRLCMSMLRSQDYSHSITYVREILVLSTEKKDKQSIIPRLYFYIRL